MKKRKGFSLIELLMVMVIIVMLVTIFLTFLEMRHRTVVKAAVVVFIENVNACKKIALMSPKKRAGVIFRPAKGPYTSYTISSDIQPPRLFKLPAGVRITDSNNIARADVIRVSESGDLIDEFGQEVKVPDPGILIFSSAETDKTYRVKFSLSRGQISFD
ncbi:MAG: prepilin-type N-terminal cleavage/methylation domain-containing protein [Candidatus Eremiobacteraeota bacterium]|nr:prepilin-type N-terminal cleavage/methylation domain-containing protein [Candidatus Eremiobacteraeota bacterium]